ncbi:MAG: TetR/AcrR family transcriptional regulator [Sphingobacteriia bacterium]|nr:TetR/AcrR family transcriptional regulator [Sphingobacteriia bacterium]NCC38874.1 TetR/AcrR family transcriptional regulator [Gammaproteobacteria bacterium]
MTAADQEPTRAEHRRQQILQAAATCFVREGFHGTSMAKISKAAGMSPGHIYHFFESKESIIAALVELQLERSLEIVHQIESADDLHRAMIERVEAGLDERTDLDTAALALEILAEAARNPAVAAIVRAADRSKRERLGELHAAARRARGLDPTAETVVTEVVMALFEGLSARAISHPELDKNALLPLLQRVLRALY